MSADKTMSHQSSHDACTKCIRGLRGSLILRVRVRAALGCALPTDKSAGLPRGDDSTAERCRYLDCIMNGLHGLGNWEKVQQKNPEPSAS